MAADRQDAVAAIKRRRIDSTVIENTIQRDRCYGCGMGLCDPQEWHPYLACLKFEATHDSRVVWTMLQKAIDEGEAPWQQ